ncbi:hypothetical protein CALVIDRAFT_555983 [Calocera viscosa TUFC12733]|uniref:Uncharacterized protein n=1 Tax=Calocera viscosa (strain TUFC12733) TaxID=1330018 RepID=A0A167KUB8_CALVF|nr:hypothetical protein CALVIDRAFT_555983 [Calocera viscosa TUFC12733]
MRVASTEQERAELAAALQHGEAEDGELEGCVARARREGGRESGRAKWLAVAQYYAQKMLLLARGAEQLVELIPPAPTGAPTAANIALAHPSEYAGAQQTADVKSAVQHALDTYSPGELQPLPPLGQVLSRAASDRRSFGETHLPQLAPDQQQPMSALNPPTSGLTAPPPSAILPQPGRIVAHSGSPSGPGGAAPTSSSLPSGKPSSPNVNHHWGSADDRRDSLPIASRAQTGSRPGPKTGSLKREELHPANTNTSTRGGFPTAEEEKRALERKERDRILLGAGGSGQGSGSSSSAPPSAYHAPALPGGTGPPVPAKDAKTEDDLPPYAA